MSLMAKKSREKRKKLENDRLELKEAYKTQYLKEKWYKITDSMTSNYKDVDVDSEFIDHIVYTEIMRCMKIPSTFLRTELVEECSQCKAWMIELENRLDQGFSGDDALPEKYRNHYEPVYDHQNGHILFDGHFPSDHVQLISYEERT